MNFETAIAHVRAHGSTPIRKSTTVMARVEIIEWIFPAGSVQLSEIHDHDHASLLVSGEGVLRSGETETHMIGPRLVEVKAGIEHAFFAKTDCVWDCIRPFKEQA